MRQTRCVRRACTGHARRHSSSFFFYPYRPALRRLLLPLSSCRGRSRSKKRRRGARAREVRERARSRVTILTVSRSCIGGATRENVVGGAGPGPSELSVCLSDETKARADAPAGDAVPRLLKSGTATDRGCARFQTRSKKLEPSSSYGVIQLKQLASSRRAAPPTPSTPSTAPARSAALCHRLTRVLRS